MKIKTSTLTGEVRKLVGKIVKFLACESPPDLILNRHCAECEYQAWRRQQKIEKDDLSLLAGMTEKERKKLNSKGIFTITQLSYTFRPRRRPKRLRDKREKYHHSLKALAIREKKKILFSFTPHLRWWRTSLRIFLLRAIPARCGVGEMILPHSLPSQ